MPHRWRGFDFTVDSKAVKDSGAGTNLASGVLAFMRDGDQ